MEDLFCFSFVSFGARKNVFFAIWDVTFVDTKRLLFLGMYMGAKRFYEIQQEIDSFMERYAFLFSIFVIQGCLWLRTNAIDVGTMTNVKVNPINIEKNCDFLPIQSQNQCLHDDVMRQPAGSKTISVHMQHMIVNTTKIL